VPGGQQANQHSLYDVVLADNDFGDLAADLGQTFHREFKRCFGSHLLIVRRY